MSEPRRAGLLEFIRSSTGCQFVIPVYQRNYTWSADREVKQYLSDLEKVLTGEYKKHFLGILIYLEKPLDFSTREFSIIDGQQRLTTTFLIIYALKKLFQKSNNTDAVNQLEGQYLTNPFHKDKIKYKLKPLVSDDDVYRCIVEDNLENIEDQKSNILINYNYICDFLNKMTLKGYSVNDMLMALDRLYVVCIPIDEDDNAQKIFESINATGVKLTSADLIRNFLLMNLASDVQDKYYANYWKNIEKYVSADSKTLELFFRVYMSLKTYELVPRNNVYRYFTDWVSKQEIETEALFNDLLDYAKIYYYILTENLSKQAVSLQRAFTDFRKINSDLPVSIVMEFYHLFSDKKISEDTLAKLVESINAYLIRRSICDMNSQNISKLFPTVLKKVLEKCNNNYDDIVNILNQELVGNNADTSGSYMPTNVQMHDFLNNANVYKRPALRIILDRLELNNNSAPVDLSKLSIEHLMPQTPTEEWLEELQVDEETYFYNLHRLGNLTLATKPDNSKMGNDLWEFKNEVLRNTAHLTLNLELLPIKHWNIDCINSRTESLIDRICELYPYPNVSIVKSNNENIVDEHKSRELCVRRMFSSGRFSEIKKNRFYKSLDEKTGYSISVSRMYPQGDKEKYWFGLRESFEDLNSCDEINYVFVCRHKEVNILNIPSSFLSDYKDLFNRSYHEDGSLSHYHIVIFKNSDGTFSLLCSNQDTKADTIEVNIDEFLVKE